MSQDEFDEQNIRIVQNMIELCVSVSRNIKKTGGSFKKTLKLIADRIKTKNDREKYSHLGESCIELQRRIDTMMDYGDADDLCKIVNGVPVYKF